MKLFCKLHSDSLRAFTLILCIFSIHLHATDPQNPADPTVPAVIPTPLQSAESPVEPTVGSEPETATESTTVVENEAESNSNEADDEGLSDAERIAELTDSIESDKEQIAALEMELENPQSEYSISEREFRELDAHLDEAKEKLEESQASASGSIEAQKELQSDVERLTTLWGIAKDRFDLAIEDRKTLKEQLNTLKQKLQRNGEALRELTDGPAPTAIDSSKESNSESGDEKDRDADKDRDTDKSDSDDSDRVRDDSERSNEPDSDGEMSAEADEEEEERDEELIKAENEADEKEAEAKEAQEETLSIEARLKDLQLLIAQEQKELNLARKKVDLATTAQHELSAELTKQQADGADISDINSLKNAIAQANQRFITARLEVSEVNERLNDHRAELSSLQSEHIIALSQAEQKRQEALIFEQHVAALKNPYTLRNILQWLLEHGPPLVMILLGMFVLSHAASMLANRSVQLVSRGSMRGSRVERENRAMTLVGVFQNAASVGIFITGTLMILEELGANITVLMGGVAVIGLAVAFGAQNLIKDYFYGFVMLLENQYMLNDTIRIGGVTGQVERITLRMTVLRDGNGVVHFIPNGTINSVSNETHGWSRAVCEIGVGQNDDLEQVLKLLKQVSLELQSSGSVGALLLESPSEPSIESLVGPVIALKISVKTAPNKQGVVKQEWYKLIKRAFSAAGVANPHGDNTVPIRPLDLKKVA